MKNIFITFILLALTICLGNAQGTKLVKASKDYQQYNFAFAIESYESLVKKGYSEKDIYQNLGNAYYLNADYEQAAIWYEKLFALEDIKEIESDYFYRYAQSLKSKQEYKESDKWMEQFIKSTRADGRAAKFTKKRDYLAEIKANSGRYAVELAPFNSKASDFAPSFYKEGIVFSSNRDDNFFVRNLHKWNNTPFLNLYTANPTDETKTDFSVEKFYKKLNTKAHESSTIFTKDGLTMYFTRNNFDKGFERDEEGISRLKLYRAFFKDGTWTDVLELPFNDSFFSVAHPALNSAEDKLFFASDRPGTFGMSDLFYVDLKEDGSFGEPINLGADVNTEGRETFPFIANNDILYFASDGHPGLGGLDIFAIDLANGDFTEILNLGEPVNSDEDDFALIVESESGKGYFSSNRKNGVGSDDIYTFNTLRPLEFKCFQNIAGIVVDKETNKPLGNANVRIFDKQGLTLANTTSQADGSFNLSLDCKTKYAIALAVKKDYKEDRQELSIVPDNPIFILALESNKMLVEKGDDLAEYLNLPIIYFDFDKWDIRPDAAKELQKVIAYMKQYPKVKIDIKSHTDSRAPQLYNDRLSERRAQATRQYIIANGISAKRLTAKGYGERQLINRCADGIDCSEVEHDLNRRSEFIVVDN